MSVWAWRLHLALIALIVCDFDELGCKKSLKNNFNILMAGNKTYLLSFSFQK